LEPSKLLASSLRQNILRVLSQNREMRVMKLVSCTGTTYNELNRNLLILEKEGIIIDEYRVKVRHGRVRVIRLNKDNPKTQLLLQVIKTLDQEVADLTCPICGTSVIQIRCESCRKKTIKSYKCQKCGTNIPNPEYGDP
jgi:predicted RNA-binding Zn-ribbon protein involved in translation (DUF1610 family)